MARDKKRKKRKGTHRTHTRRSIRPRHRGENGGWVELTQDVNCIPAGVYRLDEVMDGGLWACSIGNQVRFAIANFPPGAVRALATKPSKEQRTSVESFARRYFSLLEQTKPSASFDPDLPFTMAFMDPALEAFREISTACSPSQVH